MKVKSKLVSCCLSVLLVLQGQAIAGMTCHAMALDAPGLAAASEYVKTSADRASTHQDVRDHNHHLSHVGHGDFSTSSAFLETPPHVGTQPPHHSTSAADTCAFCSGFCSMAQALNTRETSTPLEARQSTLIGTSSQCFSSVVLEGLLRPPRS
jgi:hypothetical protein